MEPVSALPASTVTSLFVALEALEQSRDYPFPATFHPTSWQETSHTPIIMTLYSQQLPTEADLSQHPLKNRFWDMEHILPPLSLGS